MQIDHAISMIVTENIRMREGFADLMLAAIGPPKKYVVEAEQAEHAAIAEDIHDYLTDNYSVGPQRSASVHSSAMKSKAGSSKSRK